MTEPGLYLQERGLHGVGETYRLAQAMFYFSFMRYMDLLTVVIALLIKWILEMPSWEKETKL